jgi:hypothetical protein
MTMNEPHEEELSRLSKAFFRPRPAPTRAQTEAFVTAFMERLEDVRPTQPALHWLGRPWLVPALGLAFASMLLAMRIQPSGLFDSDSARLASMTSLAAGLEDAP